MYLFWWPHMESRQSDIHPSPKVMPIFFIPKKLTWCPNLISTIFDGCIKCMHVISYAKYVDFLSRRMTRLRWNYDIIDWNAYYNDKSCPKKFGEDWSCHHCQISRGLPKERSTSYKYCPTSLYLSCLRPDKASNFLLMGSWNVLRIANVWVCN